MANHTDGAEPIGTNGLGRQDVQDDHDIADGTSPLLRTTSLNSHSLAGSYQRPSFFTMGGRGTVVPHPLDQDRLTEHEWEQAVEEERELLVDNNVIQEGQSRRRGSGLRKKFGGMVSPDSQGSDSTVQGEAGARPEAPDEGETTPLLQRPNVSADVIDKTWEEAVIAGLIHTTWQREAKVIARYTAPLLITFLLQYSLTVASIFTVGHLGKVELGAVSLASMTVSITGYAVYQGLATSLDTLCAQAYGSGKKELVGLQTQRMVYFLWVITIPIGVMWWFGDRFLMMIVPEPEVATLAGQYLKVVLLGAPGYACFEAGKRYVQAQGLFTASLFVLLIGAPLNALMNWLFVWVSRITKPDSLKDGLNIRFLTGH